MKPDKLLPNGDRIIFCVDCQTEILFTVGQQAYFEDLKLAKPKRCKKCKLKRQAKARTGTPFKR